VRLGDAATRRLYLVIVVAALLIPLVLAPLTSPWVALSAATAVLAIAPIRTVLAGAQGPELIPVLKQTGVLLLAYGVVMGALLAVT
jgi:1,4-dihydroxy-2-naphthoate octaprenyltransferase